MIYPLKCTKITATIGPSVTLNLTPEATRNKSNVDYLEVLNLVTDLFFKGLNCVRFNFSHSNNEERIFRLELLREIKREFFNRFNRVNEKGESPYNVKFVLPISEMCDTKGPEIRVWNMSSSGQQYKRGQLVKIHCIDRKIGDSSAFSVTDSTGKYNMALDCSVGEKILVDDGKLSLLIQSVDVDEGIVEVIVENDHFLKANKRVNLPNADYSLPFLSDKDRNDIIFSLEQGFDFIALSFVNKVEDIIEVKKLLEEKCDPSKTKPLIISKIETAQCLKNIDQIISHSDGIMVARGDLALESPYHEVPYWTKEILRKAAKQGKPVIVATQMLDSLERTVVPTRAEVSDVYRAAELSADSTMLSGETAQGAFPLVAVSTMSEIIQSGERRCNYDKLYTHFSRECTNSRLSKLGESFAQNKTKLEDIAACFLFADALLDEEIPTLSTLKLPFPFVVFSKEANYMNASDHLKSRFSSIYRGLYRVSMLDHSSETLEECSKAFVDLCGLSSSGKLIALYEKGEVRVVPL
ncbi:pyruvate kinase [Candidatus Mycoplasma haematolamae str. Purdue]|uniref:Pyruvate kinase n=1 Tax=Mycoplasma haematolamae (strain Purdue) TaxID=1212765 RepID=I7CG85_MYCHA|nr:pyruvate kinase [Candidatus Mycoplasma haematolamae]AFO52266.1 pyruvate kinase [Candidatus Mycoplasma haematolamae str. Purdue]